MSTILDIKQSKLSNGMVVITDTGSSSRLSSSAMSKRSSTLASTIEASVRAKLAPMQIRGPPPNCMKA